MSTSGDANTGDIFINNEAEQKPHPDSNRHAEPTPSDTEAANILTTIKSGDMLRNNDGKAENSVTTTITMTTLASPTSVSGQNVQENVKILFSSEPAKTTVGNIAIKTVQKTTAYTNSNTGDLDALASAALQASGKNKIENKFQFLKSKGCECVELSLIKATFTGNDRAVSMNKNNSKNRLNSIGNELVADDVSKLDRINIIF